MRPVHLPAFLGLFIVGANAFVSPLYGIQAIKRSTPLARQTGSSILQLRAQDQLQKRDSNIKPAVASKQDFITPFLIITAGALIGPSGAFAEAPEWLEPTRSSLDIFLAVFSTLFFIRIPISWYPQMDLNKLPQAIVCWPTEPILKAVRSITPPLFGVDISPIVVYAVLSFIREIFLGQQGVLIMMAQK